MKRSFKIHERALKDETPEDLSRKDIPISELSQALTDLCEDEMHGIMTYEGGGEGIIAVNITAFGHGLNKFLSAIRWRSVLMLEAFVENEHFTILCRPGVGLPTRRELAEVSVSMRKAGFDLSVEGEVVILRTKLCNTAVLTLYTGGRLDVKAIILNELLDISK